VGRVTGKADVSLTDTRETARKIRLADNPDIDMV